MAEIVTHPTLEAGRERLLEVLRGAIQVEFRKDPIPVKGPARRRGRSAPVEFASDDDRALFEALRVRRLELARAEGIAPFMVFPDRTLIGMVEARPKSLLEMEAVHGVGQAKLAKWGDEFLAVLNSPPDAAADAG